MSPTLAFNLTRMNGRFINSLIPDETKSPVLLSWKCFTYFITTRKAV